MIGSLRKLFLISRPISWPNTAYPFAAAYLVAGGGIDLTFVVGTFYFLIPYNLLMYGINDVFDYESDIRNPRKGGIEGAREQKAFHPVIIWAAIITNVPFLLWLLLGGPVISHFFLVGLIFFVLAYSVAGLRFKEIPFLDSITSSIHFVGPMIYALTLVHFSTTDVPFIIAFFLWGAASHAFGAVQDIVPDREGGLASIATVLGARTTVAMVGILYLAADIILFFQGVSAAVVGLTGLLYVANSLPYMTITDKTSGRVNAGWRRFIWLNLFGGFVITIVLLVNAGLFHNLL